MTPAKENKFFLKGQARFINDPARMILVEKSRQVGFSFATAYKLVRDTGMKGAHYDAWVSSRDEEQAKLFGLDCKHWATILDLAAGDLQQVVIDPDRQISAHRLPFANGRAINSMSSNPNAQAGKRGTRTLDEFALHPDPRQLFNIAKPGTDWGGQMILISTHRGSANFFNQLVEEAKHKGNPKGFSVHTYTIVDALRDGMLAKRKAKWHPDDPRQKFTDDEYLQQLRSECADEESWQQEYLCQPADDQSAFLSYDLITGCHYPAALGNTWQTDITAPGTGPLYVGVDIGRYKDLTVIAVFEKVGDVLYLRRLHTLEKQTFAAQEDILYPILALPHTKRCSIDRTGIGAQFAERAQMRFGQHKVEGVNFSGQVKSDMAYPFRARFEDKRIRIPGDRHLTADLRSVRKETTTSGNIRFIADDGPNGHADRFWALALGVEAASEGKAQFFVHVA